MKSRTTRFRTVRLSLKDLVGAQYVNALCEARARLSGESRKSLKDLACGKIDFFPQQYQQRLLRLLPFVGEAFSRPLKVSAPGAASSAFRAATRTEASPISGIGYFRLAEDGRLYLLTKSEHYHAVLGHGFPGYRLIEAARRLGVPNATHNNTRGHITRLVEQELVRLAAGIGRSGKDALRRVLNSRRPSLLNRVLNLQSGSLAAEAAIKAVLGRFYRVQSDSPESKYRGRTPVIVVLGEEGGGLQANYHGTTILAQALRGMWPEMLDAFEQAGLLLVRAVRPNCREDLENVFLTYETPPYKIAGFLYELVMMNYGAVRLAEPFVRRLHELCRRHDVPTVADEIQTCVWSPQLYLFREYGVRPSIVVVGKGLPGGEYPASRVLLSPEMDCLPQFGALVTNGQEELSSLAYLVTLRWAEANARVTRAVGDYYEERLRELGARHLCLVKSVEGKRHLSAIHFYEREPAGRFVRHLNEAGLDISVQTYKASVPPSALTKLPITMGYEAVDVVIEKMQAAMKAI